MRLLWVFVGCARASFVALDPKAYRRHFIEGWPGPHDDGSGVGVLNESSFDFSVATICQLPERANIPMVDNGCPAECAAV